ncbi:universal stress protein [Pseudoflavitalea rhizosphaerae]|uniref:universal stress protein n=1 Tax=Pseudoflavitalea rhizosphaerae TaxID=1884793 RepID=UPI000F8C7721|nr:universal stress protein [Pseudoflavitalea rhizosphaerae]
MKTILVCTDFSPAARNACSYAASLADSLKARLVLINAWQLEPVVVTDISRVIVPADEMRQRNEDLLKQEMVRLHALRDLQVVTSSREGFPVQTILQAVEEWDAGIIVTGMKAAGKNIRRVFGSTVTGLVHKSNIPVIVVPEHASFQQPSNIALAWQSDAASDTDPALLEVLQMIGEKFHSAIYLVHVSKNKYREAFAVLNKPFRLQRMLKELQPELENIHGKDLGKVLSEFVRENDIQMLALMPHKQNLLDWLFMASDTRKLVFESIVPILVLPGIKTERS